MSREECAGRIGQPELAEYICDGCHNRIEMGPKQCPLCGTMVDGVRRLAQ